MDKALILSREYPPHVYGGAGVHVEKLSSELARLMRVEVRCFGEQREDGAGSAPRVRGFGIEAERFSDLDPRLAKALLPIGVDLEIAARTTDAGVVHCHTWYTALAGLWIKLLHGIPLVFTTHSLEPRRPWKEEQLGRGYRLSSWAEKSAVEAADAVIAVSEATRREVLECYDVDSERVHVIHNGIDLEEYRPHPSGPVLWRHGIEPGRPYVLFVGRITRQKGVVHLMRALRHVDPELQVVLCAGAPDTEEIQREMEAAVREAQAARGGIHWIADMLPVSDLVALYSGASLFVCPSVYEPFGIINLEAMACACPVVASRVGGIPEVVLDGETGVLVPFDAAEGGFDPREPERFSRDLAEAINRVGKDDGMQRSMGEAGRRRVEERFGWTGIARQTRDLYERVASRCEHVACSSRST